MKSLTALALLVAEVALDGFATGQQFGTVESGVAPMAQGKVGCSFIAVRP